MSKTLSVFIHIKRICKSLLTATLFLYKCLLNKLRQVRTREKKKKKNKKSERFNNNLLRKQPAR